MPVNLLSDDGGVSRMQAVGRLAYSQTVGEPDPFRTLLGVDPFSRKVVMDLAQLSFIDSAGIGWLLSSHKRFKKSGGALVLHSMPESVLLTLQVLRIDTVLTIAADEADALSRLK